MVSSAMTMEFTSMADLLADGHHMLVITHFGLPESFMERLEPVIAEMTEAVGELLSKYRKTGSQEGLCDCHLLKTLFALIDKHVQPQTMAEVACVTFIASSTLAALHPNLRYALDALSPQKPGYTFANKNATA